MASPVAGSSVGLLHLLEVPRYLRKRAHNELQAMEAYMQQQVQVAEYMAKSMVGSNRPTVTACLFCRAHTLLRSHST